jgi:hypothetical protein
MKTVRSVCSILLVGSSLTLGLACSDDKEGSKLDQGGNGTGGGTGTGTGGGIGVGTGGSFSGTTGGSGNTTTTGGGSSVNPTVQACPGLAITAPTTETCVGVGQEAEAIPVDMFIMMDKSSSMITNTVEGTSQTRWAAVQEAMRQFVANEGTAGIGVGIQFFGKNEWLDDPANCDVASYSTAVVDIGLLPTVGANISQAITDARPGGQTPMHPALQGALTYAKEHARNTTGRATVVVLVTDGFPTMCAVRTVSGVADVAELAWATEPKVRTFVIGVGLGIGGFNLNQIAQNGGTTQAILVDGGDAQQKFLDEMLNITSGRLACDFEIPEPPNPDEQIDFSKVQMVYKPSTGDPEEVPKVDGLAGCSTSTAGGWYYNNPTNPTGILVCPCTCARFRAGAVEVRLGCAPRPPPVQ